MVTADRRFHEAVRASIWADRLVWIEDVPRTAAPFRVEHRTKGVAWLTLDCPEIHNAFDVTG